MNPYHEKYLGIKSIDKNSPVFLCPLFSYVVAKKIINISNKSLFDEFEYKLGREYSKILCSIQKDNGLRGNRAIKAALEEFENFGFGKTKVILISPNKILLKNEFSPIARQYKKSFDEERKNIDNFLCGVYSGVLSSHLNRQIHIEEAACSAAGSKNCLFENALMFPDYHPNLTKILAEVIKFHRLESNSFVNYPTQLIKTAFEQGHFKKKDGIIKLWNIYSVYFKFGFFVFSNYILSKLRPDIADLYRYLGMVQSNIAIKFQKNQYGVEEKEKIFDSLLNQLDLFGYGHGNIEHIDNKKLVLRFRNIILLRQCLNFMKNFEDPYIEGVLVGMSCVFNPNVSKIELLAVKDNELIVRIKFGGKNNLPERIAKKVRLKQIKEIVNEKMKHKYYLSPE